MKRRDATGRPTQLASFLRLLDAKLFVKKGDEQTKRKNGPKEGLWKLTPLMEIRRQGGKVLKNLNADFHRGLKKPRTLRLAFSQFPQARQQQSIYPNPLRARAAYSTIQGGPTRHPDAH